MRVSEPLWSISSGHRTTPLKRKAGLSVPPAAPISLWWLRRDCIRQLVYRPATGALLGDFECYCDVSTVTVERDSFSVEYGALVIPEANL